MHCSDPRDRRLNGPRRILAGGALLATLVAGPAFAATYTWINSAGGAWSTAANWSPTGVPAGGNDIAIIPALDKGASVSLDANPAIAEVQVASGATLDLGTHSLGAVGAVENAGTLRNFRGGYDSYRYHNLSSGTVETADDDSIVFADSVINDGTILVGPGEVLHLSAAAKLDGTGTLVLPYLARVTCPIERPAYPYYLTNGAGHTIRGAGDAWVPIKNQGLVVQDGSFGLTLTLHCVVQNWGTFEVSNDAAINIDAPLLKNWGGRVIGSGGSFTLNMTSGNLGSIDNLNGGTFESKDGDLRIACLTMAGGTIARDGGSGAVIIGQYADAQNLTVEDDAELIVEGNMDLQAQGSALDDHGVVRVRGTLNVNGPPGIVISLKGGGTMILEGGTLATPGGALLVQEAGHTITGCGTLSANIDNYGVIDSDCPLLSKSTSLKGRLINRNLVTVSDGTLTFTGGTTVNLGRITGNEGVIKVQNGARIENGATGTVVAGRGNVLLGVRSTASTIVGGVLDGVNKGIFRNAGQAELNGVTLAPDATLQTMAASTTRALGTTFVNRGTNEILAGGSFLAGPATTYVDDGGATALAGGTITLPSGFHVKGTLRGSGTVVAAVTNSGDILPEVSAGGLRIQGAYAQAASGRLAFDLAGVSAGEFARLVVSGPAALDGSISIRSSGGFVPVSGQEFAVLTSTSRSGEFATVDAGQGMLLDALYGNSDVKLQAVSVVGTPPTLPTAVPTVLSFTARGTSFRLELPEAADVTVTAYDVLGREVSQLLQGRQPAGAYTLGMEGRGLGRGVYFARARVHTATGTTLRTAKMVIVE